MENESDNNSKGKDFAVFFAKFLQILYLILTSSKLGKARGKQGEVRFKPQFTGNLGEHFLSI